MILGKMARYGTDNNLKIPSLKRIMTAGAPVLPAVLRDTRKWIEPDAVIHTPYGATEALPVTDISDNELLKLYENKESYSDGICVGYPIEGIMLKVIHITDEPLLSWDDLYSVPSGEVGEITINGPNVTQEYLSDAEAGIKSKIYDKITGQYYHRTGDLGRIDDSGRVWFYGRKSQRVVSGNETFFTITCEAVFNCHPSVARSSLAGISKGIPTVRIPVICIELKKGFRGSEKLRIELLRLGHESSITRDINHILFHNKFPVDPRHNAKIFREKLALWAQKMIR